MSPNLQVCQKKSNCDNNGFLIIDANFILYLIGSICNKIEEKYSSNDRHEKFVRFCQVLDIILNKIRSCSLDETLWTSDKVYDDEMSPTNRISSLRREIHALNTMCSHQNRKYERIDRILTQYLQKVNTSTQEISEIKDLYAHKPDDEDASLIVSAIKKSMPDFKTILLTDDGKLISRLGIVTRNGNMKLGANQYPSGNIFPFNFLSFLELIHDCCNLSSEYFAYSIHYKFLIEDERVTIPKGLRERKKKTTISALDRFILAMEKKAQQLFYAR